MVSRWQTTASLKGEQNGLKPTESSFLPRFQIEAELHCLIKQRAHSRQLPVSSWVCACELVPYTAWPHSLTVMLFSGSAASVTVTWSRPLPRQAQLRNKQLRTQVRMAEFSHSHPTVFEAAYCVVFSTKRHTFLIYFPIRVNILYYILVQAYSIMIRHLYNL